LRIPTGEALEKAMHALLGEGSSGRPKKAAA
jgi:hypothetical protein